MGFFTRLSNGWEIAKTSFSVLNANKQLIIFPILSGLSLILVFGSFFVFFYPFTVRDEAFLNNISRGVLYLIMFLFYMVNYIIVVFFNMALMHCSRLYFEGEEVTVAKGLNFSLSRIGAIISWAVFAATVGTVLKGIQDNAGWVGKILIGLVGIVWSVATFFAIPVIAYENVGPIDAVKRSAGIMKEKWGETIGANFSIGMVGAAFFLLFGILGTFVSIVINEQAGIILFVAGALAIVTISSALNSIFISALYNHINGNLNDHFDQQFLDGLFEEK